MEITFTRSGERACATAVRRQGLTLSVPTYDRPTCLPHDLAHLIVERELGLRRGFWGCVAEGALFPGMSVVEGRQPPRAAAQSKRILHEMQAEQHGTEAEVLVSVLETIAQRKLETDYPAARALLDAMWRPIRPARELPNAQEIRRICMALRDTQEQWQALPVGQSLTFSWSLRPAKNSRH
ncbi:MAG: hypothetical protein JO316_01450 [Abitibacteriaceae bacterium]|nr:hypothetical protein [Abditibacteriaceae bacterium]